MHKTKCSKGYKRQESLDILMKPEISKTDAYYCRRLCRWMVENNLPLFKLRSKSFSNFLEEFTKHKTPSESLIRASYLETEYKHDMEEMRNEL